ncbi:Phospholipase D zeta 1 [Linum perenne]
MHSDSPSVPPAMSSSFFSFQGPVPEQSRIFEELPSAMIVHVSRPDAGDISPVLLSYTVEFQYKQARYFKWQLDKTAAQVFYLHFALKKRAFFEELQEKQEQVKDWLQNLGIGENAQAVEDEDDDVTVPVQHQDESAKNRDVPSSAALPVFRPALGRQQSMSDRAKVAMQQYLNHFMGNLDIVNSREVCKFLEVSKLSFCPEYGPKLKEDYIMVKHLPKIPTIDDNRKCCSCSWFGCCNDTWQKVWAVLKPGFLAVLADPFDEKPMDIIVFDVLPASDGDGDGRVSLATETKERNPLRHTFKALYADFPNFFWQIFICGWWLCPELYLRRPFQNHASSRLDALLEAKAKQGVQIYILLYKEVALALKINSVYSKKKLLSIHENVRVLRYPDHFSCGLVIIDHQICFIGGLDLCFGRYDSTEHKVGDCPPVTWPGKDYYNPRESEPNSWEDTMKDELDRTKYPRMPWHDVHCALWGPPCRDIARHFVQRWNHAKRNKAPYEEAIPLLMPQQHMVIPHYMGNSSPVEIKSKNADGSVRIPMQDSSSRSSFQDIPLLLPQEPEELDGSSGGPKSNGVESTTSRASNSLRKAKVAPLAPEMPMKSFVDDHDSSDLRGKISPDWTHPSIRPSDLEWWETQERGDQIGSGDETGEVGPRASCQCQILRSVSQWSAGTSQTEESIHNAYFSLIEKAEHFIYIEGGLDDAGAASVRAIMHWQHRTICKGQHSVLHNLYELLGPRVQDYISFYGLRSHGRVSAGGPMATSQVYVHSKIMIIDDRITLIGSANINDRSLLGSRDSEIAVIIEDKELVDSAMGGKPWKAGKFSLSLRVSLWSEHLGLRGGEANTSIYQDVFSCIPNDLIHSRAALRQSLSSWKEKLGHTTIDLGIAPETLESYLTGDIKGTSPSERLEGVKGHLVSFPLDFMCKEDLRPMFNESEYYASHVFH